HQLLESADVASGDGARPPLYQPQKLVACHDTTSLPYALRMGRTKPSLERGVPPKLRELALGSTDSRAFRVAARPLLHAHVPFDAYCVNTCDPVTRAITSSVGDGLRPTEARRLFAIERRGRDVNLLTNLGVTGPRVATMNEATRGAPDKSERMRTI